MSYRVQIEPRVRRAIISWGVSNFVMADVYMRLLGDLKDDPWRVLHRTEEPFDGLTYHLTFIDPENRLCVHSFFFQVTYAQDEETLHVINGGHARYVGL